MKVITSRDFNQDVSQAKRAARIEPVFVTDRGKATHVLMSVEAYRKLTGRKPPVKEVDLLLALRKVEEDKFRKDPKKAAGWLHSGQHVTDKTLDPALLAANSVVASTILNSDACLTKR